MGVFALLFLLLAVVLFAIAAFSPALNSRLIAAGLACLAFSFLLQGVGDVQVRSD